MRRVALVIGGGAFGTSMSSILANNFEQVIVEVRSNDVYQALKRGENSVYLPGISLSKRIEPALGSLQVLDLLGDRYPEIIVFALPTKAITCYLTEHVDYINSFLKRGIPLVSLSKGLDSSSLQLPDDLFWEFCQEYQDQVTFLSGPSFAQEILEEQITMVSIAGRSRRTLLDVTSMMQTNFFKLLPTYDIKGLLLGGALKNVLAIAGGIVEGQGFNHNTRAALITAGITEMLKFGVVFNARPETFYGFSGMGDLILTTTGQLSRNKWFGLQIGRGGNPQEIIESQRRVIEGYQTTKAVQSLAERYEIKSRIFTGVYKVLYEGCDPKDVIDDLMRFSSKINFLF